VRFSQWLSLVVLVVCLYIFWQIHTVLLLALAAVVFVVVLNRAVTLLQKRIPDRRVAVLTLTSLVLLIAGTVGVIIVPPFIDQLQDLFNLTPQVFNRGTTLG
jgi:predicted PurR-regulated permease PerM